MKFLISMLFIIFLASIGYAQTLLSLSDAVMIALENHPDIAMAEQAILRSKAILNRTRSEIFPRLGLVSDSRYTKTIEKFEPIQISFDFLGNEYTISPTKDIPDYQSNISLQATERLFTGGRISGIIGRAKAKIDFANREKEVKARTVILYTVKAYWELKRSDKKLEIEREKVKESEKILEIARLRYEKGAISGLEKARADVDVINNQEDLLKAETNRKISKDNLLREMGIIGTAKESDLVLSEEPVYDNPLINGRSIEDSIKYALSSRPEIKRIEEDILSNEMGIKVAKADYYPQVDLIGEYNWIGFSRDNLNDSWREINKNYWLVMLKVNFNLFEGFATDSNVKQVKTDLTSSRLELEKQRQAIVQEIRQAYNTLIGTAERIDILGKNITIAEGNLEAAKKQFEMGVAAINQVAEYNLILADTRKRQIDSLIDFEIAKTETRWASGEEIP